MFDGLKKLFGGVVTTNLDGLGREEQKETMLEMLKSSSIPVHKGKTEHGYSLSKVANPAKCPQCSAATEVRYADFIYGTQKGTRIMAAPAGFSALVAQPSSLTKACCGRASAKALSIKA